MHENIPGTAVLIRPRGLWGIAGVLGVAALCGALVAEFPLLVPAGVLALALAAVIVMRPAAGAYLIIAVTPLIVGIDRGLVLPVVRPNEAMVVFIAAVVLARTAAVSLRGGSVGFRRHSVDTAVGALVVTGSVLPMLWLVARGVAVTPDDVLYALVLWKYAAIYAIVRTSVRTDAEVRRCLVLCLCVGALVAVVGILQALNLFGLPELLAAHYAAYDQADVVDNRAAATIGQTQAFGDLMILNLAIAVGLVVRGHGPRRILTGAALLFGLAALASGQVSEAVALAVAVSAVAVISGSLRRPLLLAAPVIVAAALLLQPVIGHRLSDVDPATGVPVSWSGRLHNLETYFLPPLTDGANLVLGVRPAARVPSPDPSRGDWIYIESGYVWLLWTGGVPLLIAFLAFVVTGLRTTGNLARGRTDSGGVAALASFTALAVLVVVTVFDPHLTMRGSADLGFALLALALVGSPADTSGRWRAAAHVGAPLESPSLPR